MLTIEQILPYLKCNDNGLPVDETLFHAGYKASVKIANEIKEVFCEDYPSFLAQKRPREKPEHRKYREKIFYNTVGQVRSKALEMITNVRQNDDYGLRFSKETLKEYSENKMFDNQTLSDWFFTHLEKAYIDDPNSVIAPTIHEFASNDSEINAATMKIFSSEGVIQLNKNLAVLRGDEKTFIEANGKQLKIGRNLYFYDRDSFVICKQTGYSTGNGSEKSKYTWDIIAQSVFTDESGVVSGFVPFKTNYNKIPALRIGSILGQMIDGEVQLYDSQVSNALPFLKKLLQRASDSEIEILQHVHTIEWYVRTKNECKAPGCVNGYIQPPVQDGIVPQKIKCQECDNNGIPKNGLDVIIYTVDPKKPTDGANNGSSIPNPPGGFIPRNIETLRELRQEMAINEASAYGTLDMLWLFHEPLNTSGKSKAYDRQNFYRRQGNISLHCQKLISFCFDATAAIMYGSFGDYKDLLPVVNVPIDSFDISTQEEVLDELKNLDQTGSDGHVFNELQIVFAKKRFGANTEIHKLLDLKLSVDPFSNIRGKDRIQQLDLALFNDIKVFGLSNPKLASITKKYYLSKYLDAIITGLRSQYIGFLDFDRGQQIKLIDEALNEYLPDSISQDVFKSLKIENTVDVVNN